MSSLQELQDKSTKSEFDKKILSAIPHLQAYVKHRLYIAESTGIVPRNMYFSNGLIDDSILDYHESGYNVDDDASTVRLKLFKTVDARLDKLFEKEAFHKDTISTSEILEEELDRLDKKYVVDADLHFIMSEDLDDISYKQRDKHKHLFLYDDRDATVMKALEIEDISVKDSEKILGQFYSWLPINVSDIIDLYIFGRLNFEEISRIKDIELKRVERIFEAVKKSMRKNLGA
ncbi:MAG: hypothetical protein KJP09_03635 [Bacteroidia bacterium]|nr:hypothetical protein [Bacteroidia bacterium]MBT8311040.1 hypothetical protein [Bacteroidia bacterium]NND09621.1 hypothetical protein [Flavobacteriaceae bacterium]NNK27805.1 hypothetical protein [Flavobacteriaceae bacterium]NNL60303.1 hypothetical protein [Flavobacteriaceae bacterium]